MNLAGLELHFLQFFEVVAFYYIAYISIAVYENQ